MAGALAGALAELPPNPLLDATAAASSFVRARRSNRLGPPLPVGLPPVLRRACTSSQIRATFASRVANSCCTAHTHAPPSTLSTKSEMYGLSKRRTESASSSRSMP